MIDLIDPMVLEILKSIQISIDCEVIEVGTNSLLKVQPLVYNDIKLPIINDVPICHLAGGRSGYIAFKVEKGQQGKLLFSQMDFSAFMESGKLSKCDSDEMFSLNNASFLPIRSWTNSTALATPITYDFEIHGNVLHKGDWVHVGNTTHTGDCTMTGNTTQKGVIDTTEIYAVKGKIGGVTLQDGKMGDTKASGHAHGGVTGGNSNTGGPI